MGDTEKERLLHSENYNGMIDRSARLGIERLEFGSEHTECLFDGGSIGISLPAHQLCGNVEGNEGQKIVLGQIGYAVFGPVGLPSFVDQSGSFAEDGLVCPIDRQRMLDAGYFYLYFYTIH